MSHKWIAAGTMMLGIMILFLTQTFPVRAQDPTPENDANCVACHEHEYYLYDSGNWFCLCDAPMHCVYCHGGRTDSLVEAEAHEGLVLYPTRNHAERCQTCHTEDYMSRVVTFATVAGISSTPQPVITATPGASVIPLFQEPPAPFQRLGRLEPWQLVGLGALAMVMAGIIVFGYHCWKADCLPKLQQ